MVALVISLGQFVNRLIFYDINRPSRVLIFGEVLSSYTKAKIFIKISAITKIKVISILISPL